MNDDEENPFKLQYTTGHTLKIIETKGMTAGNIKGFDNFEFQLPDNMTANETLLTLTDTAGTSIDGATVAVTKVVSLKGADGGEFQAGNKVYLLKNENGLSANNLTKKEVTGKTGVSLNYVLNIEEDDTSLYLVRAAGSDSTDEGTRPSPKVLPQAVPSSMPVQTPLSPLSAAWAALAAPSMLHILPLAQTAVPVPVKKPSATSLPLAMPRVPPCATKQAPLSM